MSKRLRRQRSRTTTNNVLRLDSRTFRCRSSSMVVMLLFPGERYCFYGAARIQCLAGELSVDSFKLPSDGQLDFDSMRLVCAPYRFSRPAVFRSRAIQEPFVKYKLNRLKYRLKEITPHYEVIMESIGDIYPAVLVLDYKPPPMVKVLDQILQEFLVPSSLRSPCQFDRTLFFGSEFQPYVEDSQRDLQVAMEEVNAKRKEGVRCTIVPVGRTRSGKSTLVRHLVNTNFQKEGPPIYILDADVGQSEFIPAGCMSLWKVSDGILDVPCTHQKLIFPCCYFFGNVSPADDTERYKEIFDQLLNDFHSNSEPGSLLIINTLGWVDGLGAQLLEHIFDIARPCLAFSLSNDCGVFTIPRWVPKILRIYPMTATASCYLELPEKRPTSLQSSQLRDLTIISYFSSILPRPVLSSICDATPYSVNFKLITVCVPEDYSYVDDRYFLATLNVQIVALCSKSDGQSLETRRILSDDSLPLVSIIRGGSPIFKCHGFGIIRAVDLEKKMFYVLTPVPLSELPKITIFARGTGILVPQLLLESQPATNVPYLSRPALASKSGIISDLYAGLRNVTYQRREYFPQIV